MKKATIIGMILTLGFSSTLFAIDNVKFSGQLRHRYEMSNKDFDGTNDPSNASYLRSRFNAVFQPSYDVKVMVQLQNTKTFGNNSGTLDYVDDDEMYFHQGYVQLTDLFFNNFDLKLGRYEVVYGPQRLIGAVGWHNVARSFDGWTATYHHNLVDVDYFNLKTADVDDSADDTADEYVSGLYANFKFEGYTTQAFIIIDKDGADDRNTMGVYAKGNVFGNLSHETEFATQSVGDLTSSMFALNLTYKLGNYNVSAGMDALSGADGDSQGAFNTLYATNHKYYGYMDYFLNVPLHTGNAGLNDLHFKFSGLKFKDINMKLAYHVFSTDIEDEDIGSELDLTFIKKYNDNVKFVAGYSMFTDADSAVDPADWFYLMTIVNF